MRLLHGGAARLCMPILPLRHRLAQVLARKQPPPFLVEEGALFAGALDVQRVLYNLHRKLVPSAHLELKAEEYVEARLIDRPMADRVLRAIEQERGHDTYANEVSDELAGGVAATFSSRLTPAQMVELLTKREAMMRTGSGESDQWRVYHHIIGCIERGQLLRLMVQASAGCSIVRYCH